MLGRWRRTRGLPVPIRADWSLGEIVAVPEPRSLDRISGSLGPRTLRIARRQHVVAKSALTRLSGHSRVPATSRETIGLRYIIEVLRRSKITARPIARGRSGCHASSAGRSCRSRLPWPRLAISTCRRSCLPRQSRSASCLPTASPLRSCPPSATSRSRGCRRR